MQSVRFGLWDPQLLKRYSVLEVVNKDLFDKKGDAVPGGLYDLRLGTVSREHICATCNGDIETCAGHFGHIDLNVPVYHILFMKQLVRILQCLCLRCGNTLALDEHGSFHGLLESCKKKKKCDHCESNLCKYELSKHTITTTYPGEESQRLRADKCYMFLSKLSKTTIEALHLPYHPKILILTRFPIPPPQTHPPISYGIQKSFDDMTNKLMDIIRTNLGIKETEGEKRESFIETLQVHVSLYFDSESVPVIGRSTRPTKGLTQRIKSKEGRIRGNLNGKRVNFSARTVLTGDPTIRLEEVGVPQCIANTLTFPVTVTSWNKRTLEKLIANKKAKTLIRSNGLCVDLRIAKMPIRLEEGDTVERMLQDGDPVIFNRQPTLHRMSMMCHYAKILPGRTFRINLSATTPYNADCDGDELNLHVPQNVEAWTEMKQIMDIRHNIVSSQANKPVIGLVQDSMLAMYRMTHPDVWFTRSQASQLIVGAGLDVSLPPPALHSPRMLWSGKQIVSLTIPSIDMDRDLVIVSGEIIEGRLKKKNTGGNAGLVHLVWLVHGPHVCGKMLSEMQFLAHQYNLLASFSVGLADMIYGLQHQSKIDEMIEVQLQESMSLMKTAAIKGLTRDAVEENVVRLLDFARDSSGSFVRDGILDSNNLKQMVDSGAKGSNINIAQICGCVGLQHIEGKRPESTFDNTRCLSRFMSGDIHPKANGFIRSSYLQGLDPDEFFFHAMAGREGVIDTAIRTSETGYVQREFVKLMEDIHISYDRTVRNSCGEIIQFNYGGDGLDPTYLQMQTYRNKSVLLPFVLSDVIHRKTDEAHEPIDWETIPEPIRDVMQDHEPAIQNTMWKEVSMSKIEPGTSVGIIAAQSLGEVSTQLALNSVSWGTEVLLHVDGCLVKDCIGRFVDKLFDERGDLRKIKYENGTEWADIEKVKVYIESIDEFGQPHWTRVEGITRHPVVNQDGTDTIVRYRLRSGRVVEVTKAKGLLKKIGNRIVGVPSDEINVGDFLPIASDLNPLACKTCVPLTHLFWKHPHLDFSCWKPNLYYSWPMNESLGFFFGTYLASGSCVGSLSYQKRVCLLLSREQSQKIETWIRGMSYPYQRHRVITLRGLLVRLTIHSNTLAYLLESSFGKSRDRYRFPMDWLRAPVEFLKYVVKGYVSRFSSIDDKDFGQCLQFEGMELRDDFINVLSTLGIQTHELCNDVTKKWLPFPCKNRYPYRITLSSWDARLLKERMSFWKFRSMHNHRGQDYRVPDVRLLQWKRGRTCSIDELQTWLEKKTYEGTNPGIPLQMEDLDTIRDTLAMRCWFDEVIQKEEVRPDADHPLMYDLTVEGTRNFCTFSRLVVRDSFHHSGTTGSITSGGVPRLKRLIHASRETESSIIAPPVPGKTAQEVASKYARVPVKSLILSFEVISWDQTIADACWRNVPPTEKILRLRCDKVRMENAKLSIADLCSVIARDMGKCVVWGTHLNAQLAEIYISIENKSLFGLFQSEVNELSVWPGFKSFQEVTTLEDQVVFKYASIWDVFDCEDVVHHLAITTSVVEAFETLGVEAARAVLLREIKGVFENAGTYLNDHHYELLADVIFQCGKPMPISRHGVRDTKGVLGKASFETTIDTLCSAAMYGTTDYLRGVSERVMTGARIRTGTGQCRILVDPSEYGIEEDESDTDSDIFVPSSPVADRESDWEPPLANEECAYEYGNEDGWKEVASCETSWVPLM